jgi:hypothetical protein
MAIESKCKHSILQRFDSKVHLDHYHCLGYGEVFKRK